jgi:hypothetical protein
MNFNKLKDALAKSEGMEFKTPDPESTLRIATNSIASTLINYLKMNYSASGLNTRTGNLLNTISKSKVWYEKGRIRYSMPITSAKTAIYSNALQYGWTTGTKGVLGQKARKSLKKFAVKKGTFEFGNDVKVVPPKPYYYITDFQMDAVMGLLRIRVAERLSKSQKSLVG